MAELIRLDVAEALRTRDYPLILKDRKLLLSEQGLQILVGAMLVATIGLYLAASFWFGATRVQLHIFELGGVVAWGVFYVVLTELRRENIIELTATGLVLRPHTASAPTEMAWSDILSIAEEGGDIILMRRGEVPYRQALLAEGFGFTKLKRKHFGASIADLRALLEAHRVANHVVQP